MSRQDRNRIKWIHTRLSLSEYNLIRERSRTSTCRNLSQYIRNILLDQPIVSTYRNLSQDAMVQQMAILNSELNALGNNLNQITKRLHTLQSGQQLWGKQFEAKSEEVLLKICELKSSMHNIAERWLR